MTINPQKMDNSKDLERQKKETQEAISIQTTQEKLVPKFCTNINVGLLQTKNVVLTMAYSEGKDSVALIDRVVIDLDHVKSLNNVLTRLIKEAENEK